jgi:shikimate kinase
MPKQTIFLIGFMGSGKTTLGKKLAPKLGLSLTDLDAEVEKAAGMTIAELISSRGEAAFRKLESHTLKNLKAAGRVISTGGGTPCYFDNLQWMKEQGKVVYIEMDEAALYSRLKTTDLTQRPLLKDLDEDGLRQFIHERLAERSTFYRQADIRFNPIRENLEALIAQL